jgi:hypothetical protein
VEGVSDPDSEHEHPADRLMAGDLELSKDVQERVRVDRETLEAHHLDGDWFTVHVHIDEDARPAPQSTGHLALLQADQQDVVLGDILKPIDRQSNSLPPSR